MPIARTFASVLAAGALMLVLATSALATPTDLSLTKSVSSTSARAGETVTYTLVVTNSGPHAAKKVELTDPFPAGVTFVDSLPGLPECGFAAGSLKCGLGTVPAGSTRTVKVRASVDRFAAAPSDHQHLVPVDKVEQHVDLEPGQTRNVSLSCPGTGAILSDAAVRVDAVDQGTGTLDSVETRRARSTAPGTYEFVVTNTATGRAQTKVFGTCLPGSTVSENGHAHRVLVGDPVTTRATVVAGRHELSVPCGPGTIAVAPGIDVASGAARLVGSRSEGDGRIFLVEAASDSAAVELTVRCMSIKVETAAGHSHDLRLDSVERSIVVPAGQTVSESAVCADDAKGIVGSWELGAGLRPAGNDPQPKSRVFRIFNPTAAPIAAKIGLLCIGDRTAREAGPREIVNTAAVSSPTPDPDLGDRAASASLTVLAPLPAGSGTASVMADTAKLEAGNGTVAVPLSCSKASCAGKITLAVAPGTLGARPGRRLGGAEFELDAGESSRWGVRLNRLASRLAGKGKLKKLRTTLTYADGERSSRILRLR